MKKLSPSGSFQEGIMNLNLVERRAFYPFGSRVRLNTSPESIYSVFQPADFLSVCCEIRSPE